MAKQSGRILIIVECAMPSKAELVEAGLQTVDDALAVLNGEMNPVLMEMFKQETDIPVLSIHAEFKP